MTEFGNNNGSKVHLAKCQLHKKVHALQPTNQVCKCCNYPTTRKSTQKANLQISMLSNLESIEYLRSGTILYFALIRLSIILLIVSVCVFTVPQLILNYRGSSCLNVHNINCSNQMFVRLSVVNVISQPSRLNIQSYLIFICIVVISIGLAIGRRWMRKIRQKEGYKLVSKNNIDEVVDVRVQNYAVMLRPKYQIDQNSVRQIIDQWWDLQKNHYEQLRNDMRQNTNNISLMEDTPRAYQLKNIQEQHKRKDTVEFNLNQKYLSADIHYIFKLNSPIKTILTCYNLQVLNQLKQQAQQLIKQIYNTNNELISNPETKLKRLKQIQSIAERDNVDTINKYIVIFQHPYIQKLILQRMNQSCLYNLTCASKKKFNGEMGQKLKDLIISECPLPEQLLWENHHHSRAKKLCNRIIIWGIFSALLCAGEGILIFVIYLWFKYLKADPRNVSSIYSSAIALFISLVNFVLYKLFFYITKYEYYQNIPQLQISRCYKVIMIWFLNSGVLLICAYMVFDVQSLWVYNGLIDTLSLSFIYSIFTPHLAKYFNWSVISYLYYKWKFNKLANYNNQNQVVIDELEMSQEQANIAYQRPISHPQLQYSQCVHMMLWSSLFAAIIPISFLCCACFMILQYPIQKINLIYLYYEPKPSIGKLNEAMMGLLDKMPCLMAIGNLIVQIVAMSLDKDGKQSPLAPLVINVLIVIITLHSVVFPNQILNKIITCQNQPINNELQSQPIYTVTNNVKLYDDIEAQYYSTFQQQNPFNLFKKQLKQSSKSQQVRFQQKQFKNIKKNIDHDKVNQQLNSLSKSLASSLKERLTRNQNQTMYQHIIMPYEDQLSLQYEKKVQMPQKDKRNQTKIPHLQLDMIRNRKKSALEIDSDDVNNKKEKQSPIQLSKMFDPQSPNDQILKKKLMNQIMNKVEKVNLK